LKSGFGFALGAGLGGILFIILSSFTPITVSPLIFIYSGGAFGLGLNRLINRFVNAVLKSFNDHIKFYFKLVEIFTLKTIGVMSEKTARKLTKKIICKNFSYEDINLKILNTSTKKLQEKEEHIDLGKLKILMKKLQEKEEELGQKERYIEEYIFAQEAKGNAGQIPETNKKSLKE